MKVVVEICKTQIEALEFCKECADYYGEQFVTGNNCYYFHRQIGNIRYGMDNSDSFEKHIFKY